MRILHLSTTAQGGAGLAASRLFESQANEGLDVALYTRDEVIYSENLKVRKVIRKRIWSKLNTLTSAMNTKSGFTLMTPISVSNFDRNILLTLKPQIVHIHNWFNFLDEDDINWVLGNFNCVFTLHDERLLTGGCHYRMGCVNNLNNCQNCPGLRHAIHRAEQSKLSIDKVFRKNYQKYVLISPSQWLLGQTARNELGLNSRGNFVIENIIAADFEVPIKFNATKSHKKILFVAAKCDAPNKGLDLLIESVEVLAKESIFFEINIIGSNYKFQKNHISLNINYLGTKSHAEIYREMLSADAVIVPSRIDNSPSVVVEAQMSNTLVLASNVGGIPELYPSNASNCLFEANTDDLTKTLRKFAENYFDQIDLEQIRKTAVIRHSERRVLNLHMLAYESMLKTIK